MKSCIRITPHDVESYLVSFCLVIAPGEVQIIETVYSYVRDGVKIIVNNLLDKYMNMHMHIDK